jgi:hypothetical protein
VNTQKDKNQDSLPVISGDIKEPEGKKVHSINSIIQ